MVDVSVSYTVSDNYDSAPTTWLTVSSSEADSGLGPHDVPNDFEVVDANTVGLRAEPTPSRSTRKTRRGTPLKRRSP